MYPNHIIQKKYRKHNYRYNLTIISNLFLSKYIKFEFPSQNSRKKKVKNKNKQIIFINIKISKQIFIIFCYAYILEDVERNIGATT